MSDWHFGMVYPPVYWTTPDYDYELPEPIEAANIEGTLLVNAEEVEQIRRLKDENAKLRELVRDYDKMLELALADYRGFDAPLSDATHITLRMRMRKLGMEADE